MHGRWIGRRLEESFRWGTLCYSTLYNDLSTSDSRSDSVAIVKNKKKRVSEEIPSSAMADIAFLLLIFFLVTTSFPKDQGLRVVLPDESEEVEVSQKNVMHIAVYPDGSVQVRRGESEAIEVMTASRIQQTWREDAALNPNLIAAVKTHPQAPHRYMIAVLDALQMSGADKISLQVLED